MLRSQAPARELVNRGDRPSGLRFGVGDHQWQIRADAFQIRVSNADQRREENQPVHTLAAQGLNRARDLFKSQIADIDVAQRVTTAPRGFFQTGQHLPRTIVDRAIADHADDLTALRRQVPSSVARLVIERFNRLPDPLEGVFRDRRVLIDDPRHGLVRDACSSGDIIDRGGFDSQHSDPQW